MPSLPSLSRRQALTGLLASTTGGLTVSQAFAAAEPARIATILPSNVCFLTPQAVEGPYYFDAALQRVDITEGHTGVPTVLMMQVIEAADCRPIAGARIDVWHCDASGLYSGYANQGDDGASSTVGEKFLRGTQMTDDSGIATFNTIYPGWYHGRTTHIHFKVFLDQKTVMMSQMYFPDALSEYIYRNVSPYNTRTVERDTVNATDDVLSASGGGHGSFASIKEDKDAYVASLVIGVDRTAEVNAGAGPGGANGPPPGGPPPGGAPPNAPGGANVSRDLGTLVPAAGD